MRLAKQELPPSPCMPSAAIRQLRAELIYEEAMETVQALGFRLVGVNGNRPMFVESEKPNLIELIDGCCDVAVVTTGTLSACGVPDEIFQNAVNENNLAKFGPGHSWRADGKLVKPPGHKPPDIEGLLKSLNQGAP